MQGKQTTHSKCSIVRTLPSRKWFCKVWPLKCLLFFKSFDEIIIATCLQQGKLFLPILCCTFCTTCGRLPLNMQPDSMLANRVKSLLRFTFPLPQVDTSFFLQEHVTFVSLRSTLKLRGFVQFVFEAVECRAMCACVCGALSFVFQIGL